MLGGNLACSAIVLVDGRVKPVIESLEVVGGRLLFSQSETIRFALDTIYDLYVGVPCVFQVFEGLFGNGLDSLIGEHSLRRFLLLGYGSLPIVIVLGEKGAVGVLECRRCRESPLTGQGN